MSANQAKKRSSGFGKWIESQARILREKGGANGFERLNPFHLAHQMNIPVRCLSVFLPDNLNIIAPVLEEHSHCWDAATMEWPDGKKLVILNPKRNDPLRRHASIMEELAHVHLGHKRSAFLEIEGVVLRTCKNSNETQAYAVGSAALIPAYLLKGARTRGYSRQAVAEQHQVSIDLVRFRERVTGVSLLE